MSKPKKVNGARPWGWRLMKAVRRGDRELQLHTTKGWRVRRA